MSEDCVVETFIRLTQVKRFSPKAGDGKGFILTIAHNVALEQHRRYKRKCVSLVIQGYGEADKTVEDSIFLNQLLKNLNDKQRQIVVLKIYSELTFKEIAKIMKCPESTVKSKYKKAIEILQKKAGVGK
ncbi:MAG: sigma-70 family RNA polymerase sigma factor [Ruminococcus sp.]|nr:sigma-70 family RNA polymerase sigma factor [Ruminococcus sp.]